LYEAREQLDSRGRNLPNVTNVTNEKSWTEYLQDVGLAYRSDLVPNGTRLTCDIPLSKRYQTAMQTTLDRARINPIRKALNLFKARQRIIRTLILL